MTDEELITIKEHLLGQDGKPVRTAKNTRRVMNRVFWIIRIWVPWRALHLDYGNLSTLSSKLLLIFNNKINLVKILFFT